jgi:hypothetical protein
MFQRKSFSLFQPINFRKINDMNFYIWRDNIVGSLLGLSDTTYQRLAWTGAIQVSDGSPDEMLSTLLDDWAFQSFLSDNREQLSGNQVDAVNSLLTAVSRYLETEAEYDGNAERVLANGKWREIVMAARNLYLALCPKSEDRP